MTLLDAWPPEPCGSERATPAERLGAPARLESHPVVGLR